MHATSIGMSNWSSTTFGRMGCLARNIEDTELSSTSWSPRRGPDFSPKISPLCALPTGGKQSYPIGKLFLIIGKFEDHDIRAWFCNARNASKDQKEMPSVATGTVSTAPALRIVDK